MSVQLVALIANIALAVLKFTVGHAAGSRALIADAFNSAGDVLTTFVAWLAFRWGRTPPDANHPYGHANAEALAGLVIGAMLLATGAFIAAEGVDAWASGQVGEPPELWAAWAAVVTIVVKLGLWVASIRVGRRTGSPTLLASARDHRADVVTGTVALAGILVADLGFPALDTIGGVLIGVYVFQLGIEPLRSNIGILMHEEPPGVGDHARSLALAIDEVTGVGEVRVQPLGGSFRVDLVMQVDGQLSVSEAHEIAHRVEDVIRAELDRVTEVYVHVEPAGPADRVTRV